MEEMATEPSPSPSDPAVDSALASIAKRAHETHVVVIGGGMAGLVAAYECAKVGLKVTVLEASDRVGGVVRAADVAGLRLDAGAESFATRGGHVRALIDELGLGDQVVAPAAGGAWVAGFGGSKDAAPLPGGGVLGIPANPWAPEVRRIIGTNGSWRAYVDRLRPPLTIGHEHSLGKLVRSRMGELVLQRLVAPVTTGVYSASPDDIDVDLAAPGLNAALTRAGSLSGAVDLLQSERAGAAPGSAVGGIDGGMTRLVDALVARLHDLGVELRTQSPAARIEATGDGWVVVTEPSALDEPALPLATSALPVAESMLPLAEAVSASLPAAAVIVATDEGTARALLAPVAPGLAAEAAPSPVVEIVTLVIADERLDAAPRGTGVLTVPGSYTAKALTHSTAKWEWVARAAGPGVHAIRVSFGAQGEEPATAGLDDAAAAELALAEASALLGIPLPSASVRGASRARFAQSQPAAVIGRPAVVSAARKAIAAVPGLGAAGAWLSGTGLAQVVPDARAEADRIRNALLWESAAAS
jgi:oxygen-dependent protoporphyrinogen oxidase